MGSNHPVYYSGHDNVYIDGFEITPLGNCHSFGPQIEASADNVTIRRNTFHNLPATGGANNQAALPIARGGSKGQYWAFIDNTFYDIHHAMATEGYTVHKLLFADSTLYDFDDPLGDGACHGIGPKEATTMWFIRGNTLYNFGDGCRAIWLMYSWDPGPGFYSGNVEISFNSVRTNGSTAIQINQAQATQDTGPVYVFRNTVYNGGVNFRGVNSAIGPFYVDYNVIENDETGWYQERVDCSVNCTDLTRLVVSNNLHGPTSDNIVDSNNNLNPAYSAFLGTHGYQISAVAQKYSPILNLLPKFRRR